MKTCKDCGLSKPSEDFFKTYITKRTNEQRYSVRCKKCSMDRYKPNRGKPNTGRFKKGVIPWCTGMKMDKEYRKKLSDAHLGQIPWNLGKKYISQKTRDDSTCISRNGFKANEWRQLVLERDNFTCQDCGCANEDKKLHAHHIIKWDDNIELRFDINNGLTLCTKCHNKIHGFQKGIGYWTGKKRNPEDIEKIAKARRGVPLTEEHKQKLRDAKKLKPTNAGSFVKGQVAWNKGVIPNEETRSKMSIAQKNRWLKEKRKEA